MKVNSCYMYLYDCIKPDPDKLSLPSFDVVTKEKEETILSCSAGHKPLLQFLQRFLFS